LSPLFSGGQADAFVQTLLDGLVTAVTTENEYNRWQQSSLIERASNVGSRNAHSPCPTWRASPSAFSWLSVGQHTEFPVNFSAWIVPTTTSNTQREQRLRSQHVLIERHWAFF